MAADIANIGTFPDIEDTKYQNILLAGISLFQLIWPKPAFFDEKIMGLYNVKATSRDREATFQVTRDNPQRGRAQYVTRWQTSGNAHALFERQKKTKNLAIAWVPDDPVWHNRVTFMDNPFLLRMISQLRIPTGDIKTGAEIQMEIACMEKILKEEKPIWKVFKNKREVDFFWTEKKAKDFIKEEQTMAPRVGSDGKFVVVKKKKVDYEYEQGTKLDYRDDIKELIKREKVRNRFGWTECSQFQEKIKPEIIDLIKAKRDALKSITSPSTLSPEDIEKLRKMLATQKVKDTTKEELVT